MSILKDISLKPYNTFGLEAKANYFLSIDELADYHPGLLSEYEDVLLMGGGSNILLASDFRGLVLKVNITGKELIEENETEVMLKIGAGENWHQLVLWTLENNWYGLENLSLIPGTVGAAPIQNIGAYGVELSNILEKVEGVFLADASPFSLNAKECQLGYRNSIFKNEWKGKVLISYVYLKLSKTFTPKISYGAIAKVLEEKGITKASAKEVSNAVIHIRQSKLPDPATLGNAGSFFKNPIISLEQFKILQQQFPTVPNYPAGSDQIKIPAGWLIEQAGWKGKRVGETGAHAQQALVLVNYGKATGAEIFALSEKIMLSIMTKFGIQLEREVTTIG